MLVLFVRHQPTMLAMYESNPWPEANGQRSGANVWVTILLSGMAGAMAWGIRGQYGHETGAMIAGVLVGFTLVLLHGRELSSLISARSIALFALGISVGGCMTYGQTVGLTHDGPLVGNSEAYRWGMLGLAVKGGVWWAFGGAMFGMGLSGKAYRPLELLLLFAAMTAALFVGVWLLNSPFEPAEKLLPKLYFSDQWYWEPDVDKPRRERWGGLVAAFGVLLVYLGPIKRDWLGMSLGLWGLLGGALGFPAGQAIQAYNAWHGDWIRSLPTASFTQFFNWWNMMETTFGFVAGAIVGFGCWLHRNWIGFWWDPEDEEETQTIPTIVEIVLLLVHLQLLVTWNFQSVEWVDAFADLAVPMIVIPTICVMAGRYWPYLMALPIVLVPIAGKTIRQMTFSEQLTPIEAGWHLYVVWPIALATIVAMAFALRRASGGNGKWFVAIGLLTATWLYFGLNDAFFHSPWPWKDWTGRTPNGLIFLMCALSLTVAAGWRMIASTPPSQSEG